MSIAKRKRGHAGRKTTTYQADVYAKGIRLASRCFDTLSAAREWHEKKKRQAASCAKNGNTVVDKTVGEVFELYVEKHLGTLRPSSQQAYEGRFKYILEAPLANLKMGAITRTTIDEWFTFLYQLPTAMSSKRKDFKKEFTLLKAFFNWVIEYTDDDMKYPIKREHARKCYYKERKPRIPDYYMKPEEVCSWLSWLRDNTRNPSYGLLAEFMLLTGARLGEAAGMKWDAVNLEKGYVRVIRILAWNQKTKNPYFLPGAKTASSVRVIPLPATLRKKLAKVQLNSNSPLVFPSENMCPLRDTAIRNVFNKGFAACGLAWSGTHILRHTFATAATVNARGDLRLVQAILGHTDYKVTERYSKLQASLDGGALIDLSVHYGFNS